MLLVELLNGGLLLLELLLKELHLYHLLIQLCHQLLIPLSFLLEHRLNLRQLHLQFLHCQL